MSERPFDVYRHEQEPALRQKGMNDMDIALHVGRSWSLLSSEDRQKYQPAPPTPTPAPEPTPEPAAKPERSTAPATRPGRGFGRAAPTAWGFGPVPAKPAFTFGTPGPLHAPEHGQPPAGFTFGTKKPQMHDPEHGPTRPVFGFGTQRPQPYDPEHGPTPRPVAVADPRPARAAPAAPPENARVTAPPGTRRIEVLLDGAEDPRRPRLTAFRAAVIAAVREAIPEAETDGRIDDVITRLYDVVPPARLRNAQPW